MKKFTKKQYATITAQTPIACQHLLTTPFFTNDEDGTKKILGIYFCTTGDDMERIGRDLMYHHAIDDVLHIDLDEVLSDVPLGRTASLQRVCSRMERGIWKISMASNVFRQRISKRCAKISRRWTSFPATSSAVRQTSALLRSARRSSIRSMAKILLVIRTIRLITTRRLFRILKM